MNKDTLMYNILNGQSNEDFISLLFWGLIGFVFSVLIEMIRHKNKIKKTGGFSIIFWLKDNSNRIILSILAIIVGVLFSNDLIGKEISNWGAFLSGLVTDKIIEALTKYKSIIKISNGAND